MHVSSLDNMRRCLKRHVIGDPVLASTTPLRVLDIGGADVNGSYRPLFGFTESDYTSADLESDPSVDVVLDGSSTLPFDDDSFDVVVTGQTFEHVGPFWRLFAEMVRVCADHGVIVVIAPSTGFEHRYPIDCYRFLPDSYEVLAAENDVVLVEHWLDRRGPFHDLVGVFRTRPLEPGREPSDVPAYLPAVDGALQNEAPEEELDEHEVSSGAQPAVQFLRRVHAEIEPRFYLEVGVFDGVSLRQARCPAVGIDPDPHPRFELREGQHIHVGLSNDFFRDPDCLAMLGPIDLAYVDGMHLIENALEDFLHVELHAHPGSVILVDDIFPNHPQQAVRARSSRHWTGDVWKIIDIFQVARPDLILLPVDTSPTGCLVVLGADPDNRVLWDGFDFIVAHAIDRPEEPRPGIIERRRALHPDDPLIWRALRAARALRDAGDPVAGRDRLRRMVAGALPRQVAP